MAATETTDRADEGRYRQVVRFVAETPWALHPSVLAVINEIVARRRAGEDFTDDEIKERIGAHDAHRDAETAGPVAVLPIYGVIAPRMTMMSEMSGGTSLERFSQQFREALNNPDVSSILLDVDSPGGSVDLVPETAALIRSARGKKQVVAIANTDAYSAAYYLASQADELVVTPSGGVGSVGVYAAHTDISALQEMAGIKTTLVSAGDFKVEGNPYEPLTDDAQAKIQADVDEFYSMFVADVAKGRGIDVAKVEKDYGQGRTVMARAAKKVGMVDRIATYEDTLARMIADAGDASGKKAAAAASDKRDEPGGPGIVRALYPALELRDAHRDSDAPVLHGHFAVFNEWAEIDSAFEGNFMERVLPGAFAKTFRERADQIQCLFQHGKDPVVGNKPLGVISSMSEDDRGAAYEVELFDTAYNSELLPGLRAGVYGSSYRFRVVKDDMVKRPPKSDHNPKGLPERSIGELALFEFGPVTFPAYQSATAGVRCRSLTDSYYMDANEEVAPPAEPGPYATTSISNTSSGTASNKSNTTFAPVSLTVQGDKDTTPPEEPDHGTTRDAAEPEGSTRQADEPDQRTTPPQRAGAHTPATSDQGGKTMPSIEDLQARREEIERRLEDIRRETQGSVMPAELREESADLFDEVRQIDAAIAEDREMERRMREMRDRGGVEAEPPPRRDYDSGGYNGSSHRGELPWRNLYDLNEYRAHSRTEEQHRGLLREGAMKVLERATFPDPRVDSTAAREHIGRLLERDHHGELAARMIATGGETYQRAFGKFWAQIPLTSEEERALSLTTTAGGFAVPYVLDPTIIPISNGSVNPLRQIARVERVTSNEWRGVTSAGVTAHYRAEAAETTDDSPTLGQPTANPERVDVFIPFSVEIGMDWPNLQAEMGRLVADAKDDVEADKFINGLGHASNEPQGLLVGATAVVATVAATAFSVADLYALENALPPRFRSRARIIANRLQYSRVRQFDTAGGANLWARLADGLPPELLNYPAYEDSGMPSTLTSGSSIITMGDFSNFLIVDRVGMNAELIPHLLGSNRRPTLQRGLVFWWRNTSAVLAWQSFRTLKVT